MAASQSGDGPGWRGLAVSHALAVGEDARGDSRPEKVQKTEKPTNKGGANGPGKTGNGPKLQLPDGCTSHDDENRPSCGKCKFKGPAGKRCVRGYHKCYKKGCYRPRFAPPLTDMSGMDEVSRGSPPLLVELFAGRGAFFNGS